MGEYKENLKMDIIKYQNYKLKEIGIKIYKWIRNRN